MKTRFFYKILYVITIAFFVVSLVYAINTVIPLGIEVNPTLIDPTLVESKWELQSNNKIGLGYYSSDFEATRLKSLVSFEDQVERKMEYINIFKSWGDDKNFPNELVPQIKALKLKLILTWEPWKKDFITPSKAQPEFSLQSILDGKHDDYINEWIDDIKKSNIEVIIRFAHEMNTPSGVPIWYPWQGNPELYKKAYRYIVNKFRENNVSNVKFMWSPYLLKNGGSELLYYPGDDVVDYVGMSVLNFGSNLKDENGKDFWGECKNEAFIYQYDQLAKHKKQIIIAEFFSVETGGSKPQWIKDCLDLFPKYNLVVGLVAVNQPPQIRIVYGIKSSQESLDAFKQGIKNGFYK